MCTNPLKGYKDETGRVIKVASNKSIGVKWIKDIGYKAVYNKEDIDDKTIIDFIDIPCRSCLDCYNDTRRQWIARAVAESQNHDKMLFCTFTYSDENIPVAKMIDEDGVVWNHFTLDYKDFQKFMKRLRKRFDDREIRYMVCGEYGSHTFRPHYHAIIYGLNLEDFKLAIPHTKNANGDVLYECSMLDEIWQKGYTLSAEANAKTISYVAGYVAKKSETLKGKKFYELTGCAAPFIRGSLRPGLGTQFIQDNMQKYNSVYDYMSVPCSDSDPVKLYLTDNWKKKYERLQVYQPMVENGKIDDIDHDMMYSNKTEYYQKKLDRRSLLIDTKDKLLRTDMGKSDRLNSKSYDLRNSSRKKRGVY